MAEQSARQELGDFVGTGRLRDMANDARLSDAAQDLLVNIITRYCDPRPKRRRKSLREGDASPTGNGGRDLNPPKTPVQGDAKAKGSSQGDA